MKKNGFTIVEAMIVVAIVGILAAIIVPNVLNYKKHGKFLSANTQCIGGYLFTNPGYQLTPVQVMDEHGKGIRCE